MCVKSIIGRVKWNDNSACLKTHQDAFKKLNSNFQPVSLIQKPALITQVKNTHSVLCPIHVSTTKNVNTTDSVCEQLKITNSLYQKQSCLSEHNRADRLISRNINLALKITATCLQHDIPKYQERNNAHPQNSQSTLSVFLCV